MLLLFFHFGPSELLSVAADATRSTFASVHIVSFLPLHCSVSLLDFFLDFQLKSVVDDRGTEFMRKCIECVDHCRRITA